MSIIFNELSRALRTDIKGYFEHILDFFSSEPLIDWLDNFHYTDLMRISGLLDRIASTRKQIIDYEKNTYQYLFLNSLFTLSSGRKRFDVFQEAKRLRHELKTFFNNPKIPRLFEVIAGFDLRTLDDAIATINGVINMRLYPKGKSNSINKLNILEKERIKAKQEKKKQLQKRKKRTEEEKKKAEEDRKKVKEADFEKLKGDLPRQVERESY